MFSFGEDHTMRTFTFYQWLGISLLLHASVVAPFVVSLPRSPQHTRPNKLLIELFGMISNRQVEEKKKGTDVKEQRVASRPSVARQAKQEAPKPLPEPETERPKAMEPEAPVYTAQADDSPKPAEQDTGPTQPSIASLGSVPSVPGGEVAQRGQTIGSAVMSQGDVIRAYLAKVAKKVNSNVVYPAEARKKGVNGTPTITFIITPSGAIREGSLRVKTTSGYPVLDTNALKAALMSAPFGAPPKELVVSIAVFFDVETMRPRSQRASRR